MYIEQYNNMLINRKRCTVQFIQKINIMLPKNLQKHFLYGALKSIKKTNLGFKFDALYSIFQYFFLFFRQKLKFL